MNVVAFKSKQNSKPKRSLRTGHQWALVTKSGNVTYLGPLYGSKKEMAKRCQRWNRRYPGKPRYVEKITSTWPR
jgi:hypothetical protein